MSSHVFHEIYLHINWHVKLSRPVLTGDVEPTVHKLISEKCQRIPGVTLYGIGGTETHVHIAISIEPHIAASEVVRELKGFSAHDLNQQKRMKYLEWQRGFGVVSFGKKNLPWVLDYIEHQKEHHATDKCVARLESAGREGDGSLPSPTS